MRIIVIAVTLLVILFQSICIVNLKNDINEKSQHLDKLSYEKEIELTLKEKYYSMLLTQIRHQNINLDTNTYLYDHELNFSTMLSELVEPNDIIISIPEYSCEDCIEKTIKMVKNSVEIRNSRIIILGTLFDVYEQKIFKEKYKIPSIGWMVFDTDTKFFSALSKGRIMVFQIKRNKISEFTVLDGEFEELLYAYIKNIL